MNAQDFINGATVTSRGDDWGDPLWTFYNKEANLSIDAQGATLADATAKAATAASAILDAPQAPARESALSALDRLDPKTASVADVITAVKSALGGKT